jgi:hypothetical protein
MEKKVELGFSRMRIKETSELTPNYDLVQFIKFKTAELINTLNTIKDDYPSEDKSELLRLISLAQTNYEQAAMWAVKAATTVPADFPKNQQ